MHADPVAVNELAWWERDENTRFERASKHLPMDVVWKVISASPPINDYETIEALVRLPCISISPEIFLREERKSHHRPFVLRGKCPFLIERPHREEHCATFIIESRLLAFTLQYIYYIWNGKISDLFALHHCLPCAPLRSSYTDNERKRERGSRERYSTWHPDKLLNIIAKCLALLRMETKIQLDSIIK